jgi:hypothetical protein
MLVGGRKGHLAMMDMLHMNLIKEFEVSSFTIEAFPSIRALLHIPLFVPCSNVKIFPASPIFGVLHG